MCKFLNKILTSATVFMLCILSYILTCSAFFFIFFPGTTVPMPTTPEVTNYCYYQYFEQEIDIETQTLHSQNDSQPKQLVQVTNATWVDKVKFTSEGDPTPVGVLKPKTRRVSLISILIKHESCLFVCLLSFSEATKSPRVMKFWL